jgi:hypothetical protein
MNKFVIPCMYVVGIFPALYFFIEMIGKDSFSTVLGLIGTLVFFLCPLEVARLQNNLAKKAESPRKSVGVAVYTFPKRKTLQRDLDIS